MAEQCSTMLPNAGIASYGRSKRSNTTPVVQSRVKQSKAPRSYASNNNRPSVEGRSFPTRSKPMSNEVATIDTQSGSDILYQVVQGNLEKLSPADRVRYALQVAQSLGLNPTTAPIQILTLKGKAVLYVRKDGTEQLRKNHKVSLQVVARELLDGEIYAVTARATLPDGRTDESVGAVSLAGLKGEDRANGVMKAETKAKRRVTLSICGLGFLDESEVSDMTHDEPAPVVVEQKPKPRQVEQPRPISDEQRERIDELATTLGITREQIIVGINKKFGVKDWHALSYKQASEIIISMESRLQPA